DFLGIDESFGAGQTPRACIIRAERGCFVVKSTYTDLQYNYRILTLRDSSRTLRSDDKIPGDMSAEGKFTVRFIQL
ncbi:hypothetical protein N9K45_00150, partial [bacterium]|nr:hypothetical protein [bacterium]